ncbi:hypothetical protein [Thiocystis minor]|uniref:hypothetical protein n=1 Tax=Thiocystis minor TaxID=61597 RepID=UPI0019124C72|nr:hypothetical protein [Thiocystis minor]
MTRSCRAFHSGQAQVDDWLANKALRFYRRWDFRPLPGHRYRPFLSWSQLQAMTTGC